MKLKLNAEITAFADKHRAYANACIAEEMEGFKQGLLVRGFTPESDEYRECMDEAMGFAIRDYYEPPFNANYIEGWACYMDSCVFDYEHECNFWGKTPTLEEFMRDWAPNKATFDILTKKFGEIFVNA